MSLGWALLFLRPESRDVGAGRCARAEGRSEWDVLYIQYKLAGIRMMQGHLLIKAELAAMQAVALGLQLLLNHVLIIRELFNLRAVISPPNLIHVLNLLGQNDCKKTMHVDKV